MSEHCRPGLRCLRPSAVAALLLVTSGVGNTVYGDARKETWLRVRTPTGFGRDLLSQGYDRSATFRRLVDHLEQASVLVLIEPGRCADSRYRGCVWTVVRGPQQRSIVIKMDRWDATDRLIAVLGHELQHAVEIADHPGIVDGSTARAFFGGHTGACDHWAPCETAAAGDVEREIRKELWAHGSPTTAVRVDASAGQP